MPRYKIVVEYDGGPFVGWQRQENGPSVQAALKAERIGLLGHRSGSVCNWRWHCTTQDLERSRCCVGSRRIQLRYC